MWIVFVNNVVPQKTITLVDELTLVQYITNTNQ